MIDVLLKIAGRLQELQHARSLKRTDVFRRILEPTFKDLFRIHADYIGMFEALLTYSPSGHGRGDPARISATKSELSRKRSEFEPLRTKVQQLARVLEQSKLEDEEHKFIQSVLDYFSAGEPSRPQSPATDVLTRLDGVTAADLDKVLLATIQHQKNAWSDVCANFGRLQLAVTGSATATKSTFDQLIRDSALAVTVLSVVLYFWGYTFEAFRGLNRSAPGMFLPEVPHQDRILIGGVLAIFVMLPVFLVTIAVDGLTGRRLHRRVVQYWGRDFFHQIVVLMVLLAFTILPVRLVSQLTERYTNSLRVVSIAMKGTVASSVEPGYYFLGMRDQGYVFADNIGAPSTKLHVVRADEIAELVLAYSGQRSVAGDLRMLIGRFVPSPAVP